MEILRIPSKFWKPISRLTREEQGYIFATLLCRADSESDINIEIRDDTAGDLFNLIWFECEKMGAYAKTGSAQGHHGNKGGRPNKNPPGVIDKNPPGVTKGNPKGNSNSKSNDNSNSNDNVDTREFLSFWNLYPRKSSRKDTEKKYRKLLKQHDEIIQGLQKWCDYWEDEHTEETFIPMPTTWLNQERWKEDPPKRPVYGVFI